MMTILSTLISILGFRTRSRASLELELISLTPWCLVKPSIGVQWHRQGFRLYWRWRSRRLGRPKMSAEIRDLIRKLSLANRLWGAPRIHGELLKLGIKVSQAAVGRYMPWRPKVPSPDLA